MWFHYWNIPHAGINNHSKIRYEYKLNLQTLICMGKVPSPNTVSFSALFFCNQLKNAKWGMSAYQGIKYTGITLYLPNPYRRVLLYESSHSASQEIPHLLWDLKVHYCVCNRQTQIPIQSPFISICTLPPHFRSILYHPPIHRGLSSGIFLSVFHQIYLKFCFSHMQCRKNETEITTMDIGAVSTYSIWDCSCTGYLMILHQTKRSVSKISRENEGLNYINDNIWSEEQSKKI